MLSSVLFLFSAYNLKMSSVDGDAILQRQNTYKEQVQNGLGYSTPSYFSICNVKILDDSYKLLGEKSLFTYTIGSSTSEVEYALERALITMKQDEVADVLIGEKRLRIQLESFTQEPTIYEMSITEKWRRACQLKEKGCQLFQSVSDSYKWAFLQFSLALKYLISLDSDLPEGSDPADMDIKSLKLSCYNNLAACQLKNRNYEGVISNCTKCLQLDTDNIKSLYRRGVANMHLQWYERSKEDLERASELDSADPATKKALQDLKERMQSYDEKVAVAMKKMFS